MNAKRMSRMKRLFSILNCSRPTKPVPPKFTSSEISQPFNFRKEDLNIDDLGEEAVALILETKSVQARQLSKLRVNSLPNPPNPSTSPPARPARPSESEISMPSPNVVAAAVAASVQNLLLAQSANPTTSSRRNSTVTPTSRMAPVPCSANSSSDILSPRLPSMSFT